MEYFAKVKKQGNHQPDYVASSAGNIDFAILKKAGIKCVAFDIDGTLTKNNSLVIDKELAKTIKNNSNAAGINKQFLASNSGRSLHAIAKTLGAFEIHQPIGGKGKPSKHYYEQLIKKSGCKPNEIAMVGDRFFYYKIRGGLKKQA